MELMREVVPKASLMGVLINPTGPNLQRVSRDLQVSARTLDQQIHILHASTERDLDAAFETLAELRLNCAPALS
jgi:putative tryptophan/tyrosine transport system substrate-binding protein